MSTKFDSEDCFSMEGDIAADAYAQGFELLLRKIVFLWKIGFTIAYNVTCKYELIHWLMQRHPDLGTILIVFGCL